MSKLFPIYYFSDQRAADKIFDASAQVVCWKNATRKMINKGFREMLGMKGAWPNPGDKIVFLENNMIATGLLGNSKVRHVPENLVLEKVMQSLHRRAVQGICLRRRPPPSPTVGRNQGRLLLRHHSPQVAGLGVGEDRSHRRDYSDQAD